MGQVKALDRVGASRTIHASDMGIRWAADKLDMKVFIQPVNGHKGSNKGWFRVWRTEGLPLNEVNKAILVIFAAMFFLILTSYAADVRLAWVPSVSTNAVGTKIYWGGQSRVYTNSIDVGSVTNCAVSNLMSNTKYYFAATAYDSAGDERTNFSNEAEWPIATSSGGFLPMMW